MVTREPCCARDDVASLLARKNVTPGGDLLSATISSRLDNILNMAIFLLRRAMLLRTQRALLSLPSPSLTAFLKPKLPGAAPYDAFSSLLHAL